ncbi:hypothetical protein [Planctobacterium marinum]|uniref:hypothetical protein n=1 Tax=Planctobacterium marinum TaxID=1631968 RepID=UPI001E5C7089|nr:hypothetical protein [Planctobacterium marinum]MCC2605926.1 hypothetical protein [Planctobacterium marinum]
MTKSTTGGANQTKRALHYAGKRHFTKNIHRQAAKFQLREFGRQSTQSKFSETQADNIRHRAELKKIVKSGKTGSKDLSHKASLADSQIIMQRIATATSLTSSEQQGLRSMLNVGRKEPLSRTHQRRMDLAIKGLNSTMNDQQRASVIMGFHSVINGSNANLRHRDASENRSYGQKFHGNTTDGTEDGPLTPRGQTMKDGFKQFGF